MIKYRPHKGSIEESLKEEKTFECESDMKVFIVTDWNKFGKDLFGIDDIIIDSKTPSGVERYVCTKRMGSDIYDAPQCLGYCTIDK